MKQEHFEILISALKIILMLITIFVMPGIKAFIDQNTTAKQRQELINFANIAIKIAEEYYKDKNKGKEKKAFVIDWLNKAGIKATEEQINNIIDMIVAWYNANGWNKVITKEVIQLKSRADILKYAKSLIGYTNYKMGAKWYNYGNNAEKPKLLDCSGFVVWAYKMAGFNVPDGTYHQWQNSMEIPQNQLKIGDIGIKEFNGVGMYNHIGIYAGNGLWIHCNFSRNGVTLEKTSVFKYCRRFTNIVFEDDRPAYKPKIGDDEMIEKGKFIVNGKPIEMDRIMKGDFQFVKLQDLVKAGLIKAEWDNKSKLTKIVK